MCLAVPGEIVEIQSKSGSLPHARIKFGSIVKEVCMVYTPDARVGEYALVHAGFALSILNEAEAQCILETLEQLESPVP